MSQSQSAIERMIALHETSFRHELKHYINYADMMQLRHRLRYLARLDENAGPDGLYRIRSLYFDNYRDKAVVDKLMGASRREKFRLRYYGSDTSFIRLEKKSKLKRLTSKETVILPAAACDEIIRGHYTVLRDTSHPLLQELYSKLQTEQLRPRTIVDYHREAYVYKPGNVRITIDSNIRMSDVVQDFLKPKSVTLPAANAIVLEVKYDEYLPDLMRDAVQLGDRRETEFSKYVVSRLVTG